MVMPLPKNIDDKILELRNAAYSARSQKDYAKAEENYLAAWNALPVPRHGWDTSQLLMERIAGFYLEWQKYADAERWAIDAFKTNPSPSYHGLYLMLGKIYFESGNEDLASENLVKAFEMGGRRGFVGEDPKYLKFAQAQMKK